MLHIPHLSHFSSEFLEVTVTFPLTVDTQKTDRAPGHILDVPAETGAFGITAHRAGGGCPPVWGTGLQHVFTPAPSAPPVVPTVPVGTPYRPQAAEGHLRTGPGMTPLEQSWCRGRECSGGGRGGAGCWRSPCPGGDTHEDLTAVVKGAGWAHLPVCTLDAQRFTALTPLPSCAL